MLFSTLLVEPANRSIFNVFVDIYFTTIKASELKLRVVRVKQVGSKTDWVVYNVTVQSEPFLSADIKEPIQ